MDAAFTTAVRTSMAMARPNEAHVAARLVHLAVESASMNITWEAFLVELVSLVPISAVKVLCMVVMVVKVVTVLGLPIPPKELQARIVPVVLECKLVALVLVLVVAAVASIYVGTVVLRLEMLEVCRVLDMQVARDSMVTGSSVVGETTDVCMPRTACMPHPCMEMAETVETVDTMGMMVDTVARLCLEEGRVFTVVDALACLVKLSLHLERKCLTHPLSATGTTG